MSQGIWGAGTVLFNVTGSYIDGSPDNIVHIRQRDLIVLNHTITTLTEQTFQYNPTGPQRLNYKVRGVDRLFDRDRVYEEGRDFIVENGKIVWKKTKNTRYPQQGAVLSCVYYVTPIFIVQSLPHWLRIIPSNATGHAAQPRNAVYAPQLVVARMSTMAEEENLENWTDLPPFPDYPDSANTTGGSI